MYTYATIVDVNNAHKGNLRTTEASGHTAHNTQATGPISHTIALPTRHQAAYRAERQTFKKSSPITLRTKKTMSDYNKSYRAQW